MKAEGTRGEEEDWSIDVGSYYKLIKGLHKANAKNNTLKFLKKFNTLTPIVDVM